ncbi:hypothetical protein V8D89_015748 [Ganoderma adspersum]
MRLLNTKTGEFVLVEDPRTVHYAILSHVWSKPDSPDHVPEQTYHQVCEILDNRCDRFSPSLPGGYYNPCATSTSADEESILPQFTEKLRRFCEVAFADGFELAWVDTCCIDHANPSELEEAIASMYDWYSYAKVCYVFLPDVSNRDHHAGSQKLWEKEFRKSQWFYRGWTLQELLAPNVVIFLSKDWHILGSKHELAPQIKEITSIPRAVIRCQKPLDTVSVAQRMSWAAERKTTREEDRAYSMLGIFGVNIRISYGEGSYAFYRLQEAIINEIPDQTIFAWQLPLQAPQNLLAGGLRLLRSPRPTDEILRLARHPPTFTGSSDLVPLEREAFAQKLGIASADAFQTFRPTPYGISANFPLVKVTPPSHSTDSESTIYLALLACKFGHLTGFVALILRPRRNTPIANPPVRTEYVVGTRLSSHPDYVRAAILSSTQCDEFLREFARVEIFVAHRPSRALHKLGRDASLHRHFAVTDVEYRVQFCGWSSSLLRQQGYTVTEIRNGSIGAVFEDVPARFVIAQSGLEHGIRLEVQVGRWSQNDAQVLAVVVLCGDHMKLADGDSEGTSTHASDICSWRQQRGAAMKELGLVSFRGESPTLRLVVTHEPRDPTRGGEGSTSVYRLGVEIFKIKSQV